MRRAAALAMASVAAWLAAVCAFVPGAVLDESIHCAAAEGIARGDWQAAAALPMPPTFHVVGAFLLRHWGGGLDSLRALSAACGLLLVWAAALVVGGSPPMADAKDRAERDEAAPRKAAHHAGDGAPAPAGARLLILAWNPLLFPFLALAYTDAGGAAAVLMAAALQIRGRNLLCALALVVAVAVRQSNVVWIGLFAALAVARAFRDGRATDHATQRGRGSARGGLAVLRATWPYALLLAAGVGIRLAVGRWTYATAATLNAPQFNAGQLYLFAAALLLLRAPLWLPHLVEGWRRFVTVLRGSPAAAVLAVAAAAVVLGGFESAHAWNRSAALPRNALLLVLRDDWVWRGVLGVLLLAAAPAYVAMLRAPASGWMAALVLAFSVLFLTPQGLIDPRYYILPTLLLDAYTEMEAGDARRLAGWYGVLTAAAAGTVLATGKPW